MAVHQPIKVPFAGRKYSPDTRALWQQLGDFPAPRQSPLPIEVGSIINSAAKTAPSLTDRARSWKSRSIFDQKWDQPILDPSDGARRLRLCETKWVAHRGSHRPDDSMGERPLVDPAFPP